MFFIVMRLSFMAFGSQRFDSFVLLLRADSRHELIDSELFGRDPSSLLVVAGQPMIRNPIRWSRSTASVVDGLIGSENSRKTDES